MSFAGTKRTGGIMGLWRMMELCASDTVTGKLMNLS
jgi:hypothetical protein